MSIINSQPLIGASGQGGYFLSKSLRFRSSASANLSRTNAGNGDRQKFTWSGWVKRGALSSANDQWLFCSDNYNTSSNTFIFAIILKLGGGAEADKLVVGLENSVGGGTDGKRETTQVFRDPSAWYHFVAAIDTTQSTANNRMRVYVNGSEITSFTTSTNPTQNSNVDINKSGGTPRVGCFLLNNSNARFFDGYLAEVNFIDGQALTPSSFGETSTSTGVWIPKKYTGTYGTNGFYLPFTDVATTSGSNAGLGKDFSGNGNYWTTNNISVTSGSTYDSMTDVPTLAELSGNGNSNYCVFNPLDKGSTNFTFSNGNLTVSGASASSSARATMAVSSGKWYWEATPTAIGNGLGVGFAGDSSRFNPVNWNSGTYVIYQSDGNKHINGSSSSYGSSYTTNDVIGVALDMDAGTITFYKNNVSQGTASTGLTGVYLPVFSQTSGATTGTINANFGAGSGFAYTPPTGFKALNTFNLPTPTIGATASTTANKYFDATLYTGNGSTQSITNSGSMQPDFLWIKRRDAAASHAWIDSVRGISNQLASNNTLAEATGCTDGITSLNSNGFSLGAGAIGYITNTNGASLVAWQWRASNTTAVTNTAGSITSTVSANTTAGFSIVTYTGNGTAGATVGHGLGVAPNLVIWKQRNNTSNWYVWSKAMDVATGSTGWLYLNLTSAKQTSGLTNEYPTYKVDPTSTLLTLNGTGSSNGTNNNGTTMVAYCFAQVAGYSAFGSYTGNGSSDGTFVYTGFRPRYVLIKRTDSSDDWILLDTSRSTYNVSSLTLYANGSYAEDSNVTNRSLDFLSNGFKIRSSGIYINASGGNFIYACFAENPFKFSNAR